MEKIYFTEDEVITGKTLINEDSPEEKRVFETLRKFWKLQILHEAEYITLEPEMIYAIMKFQEKYSDMVEASAADKMWLSYKKDNYKKENNKCNSVGCTN